MSRRAPAIPGQVPSPNAITSTSGGSHERTRTAARRGASILGRAEHHDRRDRPGTRSRAKGLTWRPGHERAGPGPPSQCRLLGRTQARPGCPVRLGMSPSSVIDHVLVTMGTAAHSAVVEAAFEPDVGGASRRGSKLLAQSGQKTALAPSRSAAARPDRAPDRRGSLARPVCGGLGGLARGPAEVAHYDPALGCPGQSKSSSPSAGITKVPARPPSLPLQPVLPAASDRCHVRFRSFILPG